jgi:hydroxyacylglutathione hydrolase
MYYTKSYFINGESMALTIKIIEVGPVAANCYLVMDSESRDLVVIDPGWDGVKILSEIEVLCGKLKALWITHGHFDHLGGVAELVKKVGDEIEICMNVEDKVLYENQGGASLFGFEIEPGPPVSTWLEDGQKLAVGEYEFEIKHTPGHSPGHVVFYCEGEKLLFSGDLIFQNSIGRTDLPSGSYEQIIASIKNKVMVLPDDTEILAGHGAGTSVGIERAANPFIQ